ncbi:MAG: hypothetical protein EZS28_053165, partial [Streblomastix strix]
MVILIVTQEIVAHQQ